MNFVCEVFNEVIQYLQKNEYFPKTCSPEGFCRQMFNNHNCGAPEILDTAL